MESPLPHNAVGVVEKRTVPTPRELRWRRMRLRDGRRPNALQLGHPFYSRLKGSPARVGLHKKSFAIHAQKKGGVKTGGRSGRMINWSLGRVNT